MLRHLPLLYLSILVRTLQTMPGKNTEQEQRESEERTEKIIEEHTGIGLGFILGIIILYTTRY